jgi:hypothetical protein
LFHSEGSFPFISFLDLNVVKSPMDIKLSENGRASEVIDDGFDGRKVLSVFDSLQVKPLVVLDGAILAIILFGKEEGSSVWGIGRMDTTGCEVFLYELLEDLLLVWW